MKIMNFNDITLISSRQNVKAKQWLKLNTSQGVKKYNQILIEGVRAAISAIQNKAKIDSYLFIDNQIGKTIFNRFFEAAEKQGEDKAKAFIKQCFRVEEELFASLADSRQPQGVILIIEKPELHNLQDWFSKSQNSENLKIALLDQINDPGNLGTMIRTGNAFNYDALILKKGSVDPFNPKVMRSTMGSLFALDLIEVEDYQELKDLTIKNKITVLLSDMNGTSLEKFEFANGENSFVICIGNEAHGISDELKEIADQIITIPMPGNAESLNAAIAFGIIAYELDKKN